jgi:undecaprenyl phosphate N,N'-diacetylbacillosamine 1-phosphate transferase
MSTPDSDTPMADATARRRGAWTHRLLDLVIAVPMSVFLAPLLGIILLLVLITSGRPAVYTQRRLGRNGREFTIYKIRTMRVGSADSGSAIFIREGDDRITPIGRVLRRLSLDEIPQLLNVIRGDMALVGPRPPLVDWPSPWEGYDERSRQRFSVRPGITGLAQVQGRNAISWPERIEIDLAYVRQRSLLLDVRILFATVFVALRGGSLYRTTPNPPAPTE